MAQDEMHASRFHIEGMRFGGMAKPRQAGEALMALGLVALGAVTALTAAPLAGWQPASKDAAWVTAFSVVDGLVLVALSVVLLSGWQQRRASVALASLLGIWIIVFHALGVVRHPLSVVAWLGVAEVGSVVCSLLMLAAPSGGGLRRFAQIAFGCCAVVFGLSHFAYANFTASMVPAWMPHRLFLAYATGVAHAAAGLAILQGRHARLAAGLLAVMMGSFVILVNIPATFQGNDPLTQVTFLLNSMTLCGAAWTMSQRSARWSAGSIPLRFDRQRTRPF